MKSYTVYLFRHGLTKGNLNAQYIGQTDLPLTMDSINQLHTLRGKYPYPEVDAVFTSPLKRCKDSAAILFPRNNLITIEDFKEYNFGARKNRAERTSVRRMTTAVPSTVRCMRSCI